MDAGQADYYAENYRDYEAQNPPAKLNFYRSFVERNAAAGVPRRIHDIGCAFGLFLRTLDNPWELYGSDVNSRAIDRARKDCSRGNFEVADAARSSPFPNRFDVVTAFDVLEHVPDLDAAAGSIAGQLVQNGIFVFAVPVYDGISGPVIRLLDRDPTHLHTLSRKAWLQWAGIFPL